MRYSNLLLILFFSFFSCQKEVQVADLHYLNGYWEIEKATVPDGDDKEYTVNPVVDYFYFKNNKGFRKKVMPQLDGTYLTNPLQENFTIVSKNGTSTLVYRTQYGRFSEKIIAIDAEKLIFEAQNGVTYHYKKSIPFSLKK